MVRALLFWPAILGTAANANEAIAAADTRKVHLVNQMNQKKCAVPNGISVADAADKPTSVAVTTSPKSKEEELVELKRLFDGNLISKEAYADRQKTILSGS